MSDKKRSLLLLWYVNSRSEKYARTQLRACLKFISSALERLERLERNITQLVVVKKESNRFLAFPPCPYFLEEESGSLKTVIVVQKDRTARTGT